MNGRKKHYSQGFSLMELLVALVILALIVGLVGPQVMGYLGRARTQSADVQIANIKAGLNLYMIDVGRYPTPEEGLEALTAAPAGATKWRGPYLEDGKLPTDPWDREFRYEISPNGLSPRIFSLGADDAPGGEGENADIG
jgi:general secretion pathway protein G